ncbi:MAG TPA: hypothetical protein VMG98_01100 [Verrucomicrobiae bacterium]|nr:hypothetical protein [Verrucomicrobiae bacterium]
MARLTSFLTLFIGLAALCPARALAIAEFCPATIGVAHQVKDGGGTLYSTTLGAQGPRSVTADVEAQTENGWYQFSIPQTAIVQVAAKYKTTQLTFTRYESSSALLYVRFPEGAGNVIRWWITDAASSGDTLMGWDNKGTVACSPDAQGPRPGPTPDPAVLKKYQAFVAERMSPPLLDYDRMPGTGDTVMTTTPGVPQDLTCDKPFSNSAVTHAVAPTWPLTYTMTVQLQTLVRVDVNSDGSILDAWVFQPSGIRAFDDSAVESARRSTYAAGRAYCRPAPGSYLFRAVFNP